MKILAIETSGPVAGCAIIENDRLISEFNVHYNKKHSQSLVSIMDKIKELLALDLETIDAIAISKGPGSFTGIRIGVATAKGIAMALRIPIIPIPSVDSIAYNLYRTDGLICPLMDARRHQVYTGIYEWADSFVTLRAQCVVSISEIIEDLNSRGHSVVFLGDGITANSEAISELMKVPYSFAPSHLAYQRAGSVATLALLYYEKMGDDCFISADEFRPEYLRLSQAEQEHSERRHFSLL